MRSETEVRQLFERCAAQCVESMDSDHELAQNFGLAAAALDWALGNDNAFDRLIGSCEALDSMKGEQN